MSLLMASNSNPQETQGKWQSNTFMNRMGNPYQLLTNTQTGESYYNYIFCDDDCIWEKSSPILNDDNIED